MKFNEQKLRRIMATAKQRYGALREIQDEYVEAKATLDKFDQDRAYKEELRRHHNHMPGRDDEERKRLAEEVEKLSNQREEASAKWRSAKAVADRCENYARQHLGWAPERAGHIHGNLANFRGHGFTGGTAE